MLDLKRNYNGKWTGSAADQLGTYLTVLVGNKCWGKAGFVLPIRNPERYRMKILMPPLCTRFKAKASLFMLLGFTWEFSKTLIPNNLQPLNDWIPNIVHTHGSLG